LAQAPGERKRNAAKKLSGRLPKTAAPAFPAILGHPQQPVDQDRRFQHSHDQNQQSAHEIPQRKTGQQKADPEADPGRLGRVFPNTHFQLSLYFLAIHTGDSWAGRFLDRKKHFGNRPICV
jgi:hypothetical protein